jgi:hypothetical protein
MKTPILFLFTAFLALPAFATDDTRAVLITPAVDTAPAVTGEDFSIVYDPKQVADAPPANVTLKDLEKMSEEMKSAEYQARLEREIVIPDSTDEAEQLKSLSELDEATTKSFIGKKNRWLEKVAKSFSFLRTKPKRVNGIVNWLNRLFFRNSLAVASANANVTTISFGVGGGIGLNDWLIKQIRKIPVLSNLPERAGFYLAFSTGISFVRTHENGKSKFSFEPILEFRRATRIFSPFAFGAIGFTGNQTWEYRSGSDAILKAKFIRASSLNVLTADRAFGFSGAAALPFPPGGGAIAGMEGDYYRIRPTPKSIVEIVDLVRGYVRATLHRNRCSAVWL